MFFLHPWHRAICPDTEIIYMNNHAQKKTWHITIPLNPFTQKTLNLQTPQRSRWGWWHLCCRSWRPVTWFASLSEASARWQREKKKIWYHGDTYIGFLLHSLRCIYITLKKKPKWGNSVSWLRVYNIVSQVSRFVTQLIRYTTYYLNKTS